MSRKPKPKNTLSAGERAALYEAEQLERRRRMRESAETEEKTSADVAPEAGAEVSETAISKEAPKGAQQTKKALPKPEVAVVRVDLSVPVGEIRPMHGMCNGPVSYGADISELFRDIGVPYVRFDSTDTAVSAYAVDVSRIFKSFDADPSDPESYDFETTDRYVEAAVKCGARVIYRLGESRDLLGEGKSLGRVDVDILCRVCVNIIRHYNDRWAGGYSFGIDTFELWNDGTLAADDPDADFEVYRRLAGAIKLYDESLRVGGMSFRGFGERTRSFLKSCRRTRTPVDFISVDLFEGDPHEAFSEAEAFALSVKRLGFNDTEIIVGRWSYADREALGGADFYNAFKGGGEKHAAIRRRVLEEQCGVKGAAYAAAFMLEMSRAEGVSLCCFYDAQPAISPFCAIADRFGDPRKPYYVFKAFGKLYRAGERLLCEVDESEGYAHPGIYAAAARSQSGECYIMLSSFGGCGTVDIRLDGIPEELYSAEVYLLDGVKDLTSGDAVPLSGAKKRIVLNLSRYGVALVKLY